MPLCSLSLLLFAFLCLFGGACSNRDGQQKKPFYAVGFCSALITEQLWQPHVAYWRRRKRRLEELRRKEQGNRYLLLNGMYVDADSYRVGGKEPPLVPLLTNDTMIHKKRQAAPYTKALVALQNFFSIANHSQVIDSQLTGQLTLFDRSSDCLAKSLSLVNIMDFRTTFDKVPHDILKSKVEKVHR